jgi:hypothetical protein
MMFTGPKNTPKGPEWNINGGTKELKREKSPTRFSNGAKRTFKEAQCVAEARKTDFQESSSIRVFEH